MKLEFLLPRSKAKPAQNLVINSNDRFHYQAEGRMVKKLRLIARAEAGLKDAIGDTLVTIIVLAHQLDLDVTECLSIAYEEIKNRKGKMVNGTFVKEEDL